MTLEAADGVIDRVLYAFRTPGERLTLSALSARSGLPKPTALRIVRTLQSWGAVERQEDGSYVLGLRLLELATLAPRGHGLRAAVLPLLEDLHAATRQHVLLAVREGDESIIVERLSAAGSGKVLYRVGGRMPLHATGVGRVLLAYAATELQESVLGGPLMLHPERQPLDALELRRTLAAIRREGIAIMRRRDPEPMVSVAAPVFGPAREVVAAISVLFPQDRPITPQIKSAVQLTARGASREVGRLAGAGT